MARKKIHGTKVGTCAVHIYRDSEWDDYIVKTVISGRVVGGKDGGYHSADKADARATAARIVGDLRRDRRCR